jgi:hypothetical protein
MLQRVLLGEASYQGLPAAPRFPGLLLPYAAWDSEQTLWMRESRTDGGANRRSEPKLDARQDDEC